MPDPSVNVIVLSQRPIVRELLAELLRIRCGARILEKLEAPRLSDMPVPAAALLVCDPHGQQPELLDEFLKGLHARSPGLRVARVEDSNADFDAEGFMTSIRSLLAAIPIAHEQLTPLEMDVMLAVAAGYRNAEIARRMRRSFKTVEKHRANALRKLGVRTVAQLTAYAIHHGLLSADAILQPRRQP